MAALSIPSGWNEKHQREDLPEKANPHEIYTCLNCHQRLQVIEARIDPGNIPVRQHYRHRKDALHKRCQWRTLEEVGIIRTEAIHEARAARQEKRLRVFLERRTYADDFEMLAQLPALTDEDARAFRMATSRNPAEVLSVSSSTVRSRLLPQLLLPNQGAMRVALDAAQNEHSIKIEGPTDFSIKGIWSAKNVQKAVFIGQEESAELVASPKYVTEGTTLFFRKRMTNIHPDAFVVKVQNKDYVRITATNQNFEWIKAQVPSLIALDSAPLRVNIILPFLHDPRAERSIRAPVGEKCVLAVVAGKKLDPELDVIDIGLADSAFETLPATGVAKPRFIEFSMPSSQRQLIVLWPYVGGREITLDIAPAPDEAYGGLQAPDFGVEVIETGRTALAEFEDVLVLETNKRIELNRRLAGSDEHPVWPQSVKLCGFKGMRVMLRSEYPNAEGQPRWREEGFVTEAQFTERIESILRNGSRRVEVDFGPLGHVMLQFDYFYDQRVKEEREERERREAHRAKLLHGGPTPKLAQSPRPLAISALDALEARSQRLREEARRREVAAKQQEEDENEYERILKDPALQRRIRQERMEPRDVNRTRTARILQISPTPESDGLIAAWRYAIRRWVKENPAGSRKKLRRRQPSELKSVTALPPPTDSRGLRRHHDERKRKVKDTSPAVGVRSKRELRAKLREAAKVEEARNPLTPPVQDFSQEVGPQRKSKRDQLKELKTRAQAGEAVEPPRAAKPKRTSLKEKLPDKESKPAAPPPKLVDVLNFDRRLRRLDKLPEEMTAELVASVYHLTPDEAEQTLRVHELKLDLLFAREKARRKRDEDATKTRRDTR